MQERADLWPAVGPTAWPAAPDEMTVTTLGDIEACPRRWALAAANYPQLWSGRGYPAKLQPASLAGSVVHSALETVTKAFVRAGCRSVQDPHAVQVMKDLGGYTKVLNDCVERVLRRFSENPRATRVLDLALRFLRARIPEMRAQVQSLLGRLRIQAGPVAGENRYTDQAGLPLRPGTYPELELRTKQFAWRGKADIVAVTLEACEIVDFKTGAHDDAHRFQLRVYAWLWNQDVDLNPNGLPIGKLTLSYPAGDVQVEPPPPSELDSLGRELAARREAAIKGVRANPPEARPSAETCRYCAVRHLCEVYWQPTTQRSLSSDAKAETPFMDLEISILGRHGASSWDGVVEASPGPATGKRVLLRVVSPEPHLQTGDRVRVLDAHVPPALDNDAPAVATMSAVSEVFLVRNPNTKDNVMSACS